MIQDYLNKLIVAINNINKAEIHNVAATLKHTYNSNGNIYIFGNGGSATTASHFTQDLNKGLGYRAICLNDSTPSVLAYGNDNGFDSVFKLQLEKLLRDGDVVIGISCSGNSANVLRAIEYANKYVCTIGFIGYDGGELKKMVNYALHIPIDDMQICEDCHLILGHLIYRILL